ncbi:MAG TPA: methylamine utilization protein, partial [Cellvibrio sp.]
QPLTAIIDQHNKMFTPSVMAIRTNTLVKFPNSDDIRHHVYSFSPAKKFELRLYHGMTAEPVLFDKAGTVVLGCNIHDSMVAYIFVVDTEYHAVGDAQGNVRVQAPAGKYQLQVFHPRLTNSGPEIAVTLSEKTPLQQQVKLDNLTSEKNEKTSDEFSGLF